MNKRRLLKLADLLKNKEEVRFWGRAQGLAATMTDIRRGKGRKAKTSHLPEQVTSGEN